jgi:hypothetical protein
MMKRFLKMVVDVVLLLCTCRGKIADDAVKEGYIDFSGQGRDKHGK